MRRMLTTMLVLALGTFGAAFPVAAQSLECNHFKVGGGESFPIVCRGPISFSMFEFNGPGLPTNRMNVLMAFNAHNAAAGPVGFGLAPGSCAWVDRPLGPQEGRHMRFEVAQGNPNADVYPMSEAMWTTLQACNLNPNCRFAMCAKGRPLYLGPGPSTPGLEGFGTLVGNYYPSLTIAAAPLKMPSGGIVSPAPGPILGQPPQQQNKPQD